jgi:hypothetical protein
LNQGCCSVGAELLDDDEARTVAALGATLDPERFQFWAEAAEAGTLAETRTERDRPATRVVDGACIFLNRPGFAGGTGCALHLAAVDEGESPLDWKPSVCWQLPLKVETDDQIGHKVLRRWSRADWGPGGDDLAWCCTEPPSADADGVVPTAFAGSRTAAETLADELAALVGAEVAVEIRRSISGEPSPG